MAVPQDCDRLGTTVDTPLANHQSGQGPLSGSIILSIIAYGHKQVYVRGKNVIQDYTHSVYTQVSLGSRQLGVAL